MRSGTREARLAVGCVNLPRGFSRRSSAGARSHAPPRLGRVACGSGAARGPCLAREPWTQQVLHPGSPSSPTVCRPSPMADRAAGSAGPGPGSARPGMEHRLGVGRGKDFSASHLVRVHRVVSGWRGTEPGATTSPLLGGIRAVGRQRLSISSMHTASWQPPAAHAPPAADNRPATRRPAPTP